MANKAISELISAERVSLQDYFLLEQNGIAKNLQGRILKNWLLELAQGHGGITSIALQSTSGLNKTYRITLADDTYFDMVVSDGKGITSVAKTGTSGLVDTYTMKFNAGSDFVFTVKNGEKGDTGDADRLYFKFASQKPTDASHDMGDIPDEWLGFYAGTTLPSGWQDYTWVRVRGDKGDKGDPAKLTGSSTTYMVSDSGTIVPSGSWVADVPSVPQGKYLWTKTVLNFNTGNPVTSYSVSRFGLDGTGAVNAVNSQEPDSTGNVRITAENIPASDGRSVQAALDEAAGAVKTVNGKGPDGTGKVTLGAEAVGAQPKMEPWKDYILLTDCNNAGAHNAIYRGKNLGNAVTDAQWAAIQAGTFDDLFIGDFWTINGVNWRIAAFDYYLHTGDQACTAHHAVMVPDTVLYKAQMHNTQSGEYESGSANTTNGGYVETDMYKSNLAQAKTAIKNAFGSHVLNHRVYLANAITNGHPSGGSWYDSEVELMNEQMAYGGPLFMPISDGESIFYNYRIEKSQLPLFQHDPSRLAILQWWWLRDVVSTGHFADVDSKSSADCSNSTENGGVRPVFCIS